MDWKDRSKLFCRETLPRLGGNLLILIFFLLMLREIFACGSAGNQLMVIFNVLKAWLFATIAAVLLVRMYLPAVAEKITFGLLYPKKYLKAAPPPLSPIYALIAQGNLDEAEVQLAGLAEKYPGNAEITRMLMDLYTDNLGRDDLAAAAAEKYFSNVRGRSTEDHFRILMRYADLLQGTEREDQLRIRLEKELKSRHLTGPQTSAIRCRLENLH